MSAEARGEIASLPPGSPRLQSHYTSVDIGSRRPLARKFDPYRQLLRLLFQGFLRWIVTVSIIVAAIATVWVYSDQPVLVSSQTRIFNALMTGLLLGLNMNMQVMWCSGDFTRSCAGPTDGQPGVKSAFKQAAIFMKWKIISSRRQSLREVGSTCGHGVR